MVVAVVGVCGLPGAGKTTLVEAVCATCSDRGAPAAQPATQPATQPSTTQTTTQPVAAVAIHWDDVLPQWAKPTTDTDPAEHWHADPPEHWHADPPEHWHADRRAVLDRLRAVLAGGSADGAPWAAPLAAALAQRRDAGGAPLLLVLVDDVHYYASMRHELYLIARHAGACYVQLYVPATLDLARERNRERALAERQPDAVLVRLAARFEPPDPSTRPWEVGTVLGAAPQLTLAALLQAVDNDLPRLRAWQADQEARAALPRQQELERARLHANAMHQADLALRAAASRLLKPRALSADHRPAPDAVAAAKARILQQLRSGALPMMPDDDAAHAAAWADRIFLAFLVA